MIIGFPTDGEAYRRDLKRFFFAGRVDRSFHFAYFGLSSLDVEGDNR